MKLSCEIIEDLIPLYLDEVCTLKSREAVEEHLKVCQHCREQVYGKDLLIIPQISAGGEEKALKKCMKKIRHRWWLSVIAVFMVFPLVILGIFVSNEIRGEGVAFSNLGELWSCNGFLNALRKGDGEKAASYIDFSSYYEECREALEMTPEDHMPKLTEMEIEGERWLVRESIRERYADVSNFWIAVIENEDTEALVPVEEFLTVVQEKNAAALQGGAYRMPKGACYFLYETDMGSYMIHEQSWELLRRENVLITDCISMVPADLYSVLEPILRERAEEWCRNTTERLSDVEDLDREGFCAYMQEWYGEKLERFLAQGFFLEKHSYGTSYTADRGWNVTFYAMVGKNGEQERVRFVFSLEQNKIYSLFATEDGEGSDAYDILTPRF